MSGSEGAGLRQRSPATRHLLRNGSDALRGVLDHHHRHLDEAAWIAAAALPDEPAANDNTLDAASAQDPELPVTQAERWTPSSAETPALRKRCACATTG